MHFIGRNMAEPDPNGTWQVYHSFSGYAAEYTSQIFKEVDKVKNKLLLLFTMLCCSLLTFFALMTSVSACHWGTFQPKEPKCLE